MHWCREVKQFASATISQTPHFADWSFWFAVFCVVIARSTVASNRNVRQGTGAPARDFGFRHFIEPLKEKEARKPQPFHLDSIKLRSQGSISQLHNHFLAWKLDVGHVVAFRKTYLDIR